MGHIDLQNKHYCEWIEFLKKTEVWSKQEVDTYQLSELKQIFRHAFLNTAGYRKLYEDCGIGLDFIKNLQDFQKLPFLTKEMMRDRVEEFSAQIEKREYITTGGSTGIPFGFYRDPVAFGMELASKAYQYYRIGWKEGDRQMVFRGLVVESSDHMKYFPEFYELRCSSYHLTPEHMERYRQKALEFKPEWVKGYPSSLYIFAQFLKQTGKSFPRVKGVLCASENLYDYQKKLFQEVFGGRVFSHYGHYELAALAGFCETEDTYHVLPQYGYVELIGKDGKLVVTPGQVGEIVATSFLMRATPFIRYRTRDFAVLKGWGCVACRRPYQVWERIEGRLQEFIVTGKDRYIAMTAVNMHDDIFDHIKQFQFYQEEKGKLTFRYIPKDTCSNEIVKDMKKRLLVKFGQDVELEMQAVQDIPLTSRGKHRFLIQKMKVAYGDA